MAYDGVLAAAGLHPADILDEPNDCSLCREMAIVEWSDSEEESDGSDDGSDDGF